MEANLVVSKWTKALNVLALLGAVAWLVNSPSWEPGVTALALLATLIAQFIPSSPSPQDQADRRLRDDLLELLPSSKINFIADYDFGSAFRTEWIQPLFTFLYGWNDAQHEFNDPKLETKRKTLHSAVDAFIAKVAHESFPEKESVQRLPRELQQADPARYSALSREINDLAKAMADAHANFVRTAAQRTRA